jgi:hypothetical protein
MQWPESHQGPVIMYMARCPDEGCDKWQTKGEKMWFKIQEEGELHTDTTTVRIHTPTPDTAQTDDEG